jgi:proteasome lid subunit RPN8/RPN11
MQWMRRFLAKLFPRITSYDLQPNTLAAMRALALETHPKEAFGILRGSHKGSTLVVDTVSFQPFTNTRRSATARIDVYALNDLVGTFHSHPSPDGTPSTADMHLFSKHPGVHCIIAYPYRTVHVYSHKGELLGVHKI